MHTAPHLGSISSGARGDGNHRVPFVVFGVLAASSLGGCAAAWDAIYGREASPSRDGEPALTATTGAAPVIIEAASTINPAIGAGLAAVLGIVALFRPRKPKGSANG